MRKALYTRPLFSRPVFSRPVFSRRNAVAALGAAAILCGSLVGAPLTLAADKPTADLVVVVGATGRTGRLLVQQLVAKNYRVRALVRDKPKAKEVLPSNVELMVGDVRDPVTLAPALAGAKYVISAAGASGAKREPGNGSEDVDHLGTANLAAAAKAARVSQLVLVSSMGTSNAAANPLEFMRPVLAAKFKGELALRTSGVPYTIVKPGGLIDDAGGKLAVAFAQSDGGAGRIPRADVATVCVEALGRNSALRKSISVVSGAAPAPNNWDREFKAIKADPR